VKTAAVLSSLITVGSLAFAAGQSRVAVSDAPPTPPLSQDHDQGTRTDNQDSTAMQASVNCATIGEPEWWFTVAHRLPDCVGEAFGDAGILTRGRTILDLNGDGVEERVVPMKRLFDYSQCCPIPCAPWTVSDDWNNTDNSQQLCGDNGYGDSGQPFLFLQELNWTGDTAATTLRPIALRATITYQSNVWVLGMRLIDFIDVDRDGDLDLIVRVLETDAQWSPPKTSWWWMENTFGGGSGFAGADINRDGVVNGKDLAYVISAWTQ
jgi:hypothetical protein